MGYSDAYPGGYGALTVEPATSLLLETDPDVWEDISDYLISGSTVRGRQQELDQYQAGVCELLLDNDDRTFDPTYASSPLDGYIRPMKRIKLVGAFAGESYPIFTGYADRWTQNREGPHRGTTSLVATDGFKKWARARLPSSAYVLEVLADGPVHWWKLDEPAGTDVVFDSVGDYHLTGFSETPTFGAEGVVARDAGGAMEIDHDDEGVYSTSLRPPVVDGAPCTIEVVLSANTASGGVLVFTNVYAGSSGFDDELIVRFDATDGEIEWAVFRNGSGTLATSTTTSIADGDRIHIACTWESNGDLNIYRNGVDVTSGTPNVTAGLFAPTVFDRLVIGNLPPDVTDAYWGRYQFLAVYDQALSAARIAAHAEAVATPWAGDTPEERLDRIADAIGWPSDLRDFDTGSITLQPVELATTALEHAQKVADSDFGNLFVTADGTLRFEGRDGLVNQDVVAAFSDAAGSDLPIAASSPELSEDLIRNDVTISRTEGVAQNVRDTTSIDEFGPISYIRDGLLHDNDTYSLNAAQFLASEYSQPVERVNTMTVNPYRDPTNLWPAILGLELGDWVDLEETPQHVGPAGTRTLAVEGIAHTFGPKAWTTELNLSPAFGTGDGDDCVLELNTGPCGLDDARLWF